MRIRTSQPSTLIRLCQTWLACAVLCVSLLPAQEGGGPPPGGGGGGPGGGGFGGGGGGGFGGRGRGRGGFGPPSMLGETNNETMRKELEISDEQYEQIKKIEEETRLDPRESFSRMRDVENEEDRAKIMAEIRTQFEQNNIKQEEAMKNALKPEQFQRLQQVTFHRMGSSALLREDVRGELGISDEQKAELEKLNDEYNTARREGFFNRKSGEEMDKMRVEFETKINEQLTPEQRGKWDTRRGPPPADMVASNASSPTAPGAAPQPPPRPRPRMVIEKPEDEETVASLALADGQGPEENEDKISFNFRYAPWGDVLKLFAEHAKLTLDLDEVPPGTFNYFDKRAYTSTEALDVLNGYLLPKGFVLIQRDEFLVCLNLEYGVPPNLVPEVKPTELLKRGRNELLRVIFELPVTDVDLLAKEIDSLKGPQGTVVALKTSRAISVTDIGSNLRRVYEMVKAIEARGGPQDIMMKSYKVENLDAGEAEIIVRGLLGLPASSSTNVSSNNESRGDPRFWRPEQQQQQQNNVANQTVTARVTSDQRTNQLLVSGTAAHHAIVTEAIKTIDIEGEGGPGGSGSYKPYLRVYTVKQADAREVAKSIDAIIPGIVVNEDGRNNKIHIKATNKQHTEVEELISQFDGEGTGTTTVAVISLSRMDPISAAAALRSMFISEGDLAPTIEPDLYSRQVMIRGTNEQVAQVRTLLASLGEDGTGKRANEGGRLRSIPLSGRDPEELLPLLEKMWAAESSTTIRVVSPNDRGPVKEVRPPTQRAPPAAPVKEDSRSSLDQSSLPTSPNRSARSASKSDNSGDRNEPPAGAYDAPPVASRPVKAVESHHPLAEVDSEIVPRPTPSRAVAIDSVPTPDQATPAVTDAPTRSAYSPPAETTATDTVDPIETNETPNDTPPAPPATAKAADDEADTESSEVSEDVESLEESEESEDSEEAEPVSDEPDATSETAAEAANDSAAATAAPAVAASNGQVTVTLLGDEMVISSPDPAALDRFEELYENAMAVLPPSSSYTVFPLQSADATEAAVMLEQLFPDSTVSQPSSGGTFGGMSSAIGGFGSSLMDMTGINELRTDAGGLKIIPETRLNALFVSGPSHQVRKVEEMLRILDATDLPGTRKSRTTHMLAIEHADAQDVFNIVKEAFKDSLANENGPFGGNPANALAAMMGGGGGKNDQKKENEVKLTLAVDTRTNHLIVSAGDELFQDIEALVQSIDKSAQVARRSVRVIPLQNTTSSVITSALGSLMPKARVSSTGSRRPSSSTGDSTSPPPASPTTSPPTSESNSGSGRRSSSNNDQADQFRRAMEQQMRSQFSGGDRNRGGRDGGGFTFPGGGGGRGR